MDGVRIDDILELEGLALRPIAGDKGRSNPVRWVHVSELEDPTPWLKGGELLLTTGMGLDRSPARQRAYVERLSAAGLSGLGFGVGFSYAKVPKALADAAEKASFPVFEVPHPVPFIAITEAVYTRLTAGEVELLRRSTEAQATMTRAMLAGDGVAGVSVEVARILGTWIVVLDAHGALLAASPQDASAKAPGLWGEIRRSRREGTGFSVTVAGGTDAAAIHPIGVRGHVEGYLATGASPDAGRLGRAATGHALSLLAIELDKTRAVAEAERRLRGDILDALARGELTEADAARGLERFGFARGEAVMLLAVESGSPVHDLLWAAEDILSLNDDPFLTVPRERLLYVLVRADGGEGIETLQKELAARLAGDVRIGAGTAVPAHEASRSMREAGYALEVCRVEQRRIADFRSLGTYRLLLAMQEPEALRAFADAVLAPLDAYDAASGGGLLLSLQAFLDHNARWESAAAELFVHRHTLRYRVRKIEELTGRDLDSAHDRMEFWLALRARELLQGAAG